MKTSLFFKSHINNLALRANINDTAEAYCLVALLLKYETRCFM